MASLWMIEAVRRDRHGDVERVRWGRADTTTNKWEAGWPREADVVDVVNEITADTYVGSRLANGAPGPRVRWKAAEKGGGHETIKLDLDQHTWDDVAQF